MARDYRKNRQVAKQLAMDTGCTGLYIRVSTEKQADEGFSLDAQQERLRAYCQAQGWSIDDEHIYIDAGVSGKSENRPAYNRMKDDARAGKIQRIVAMKLDRLARNVKGFLSLVDELQLIHCDLVLIKESFDTSTPHGRFALTMFAAMAELEASTITERVMSGKEQKATEGGYNGSRCPIGYIYTDGKFEATERSTVVCDIFQWFNTGVSLNAIMRNLNDSGVPTATGKGEWSIKGIKHILANGAYAGIAQWKGIEAPGSFPAIIDRATYDAAQERLTNLSRGARVDLSQAR